MSCVLYLKGEAFKKKESDPEGFGDCIVLVVVWWPDLFFCTGRMGKSGRVFWSVVLGKFFGLRTSLEAQAEVVINGCTDRGFFCNEIFWAWEYS